MGRRRFKRHHKSPRGPAARSGARDEAGAVPPLQAARPSFQVIKPWQRTDRSGEFQTPRPWLCSREKAPTPGSAHPPGLRRRCPKPDIVEALRKAGRAAEPGVRTPRSPAPNASAHLRPALSEPVPGLVLCPDPGLSITCNTGPLSIAVRSRRSRAAVRRTCVSPGRTAQGKRPGIALG